MFDDFINDLWAYFFIGLGFFLVPVPIWMCAWRLGFNISKPLFIFIASTFMSFSIAIVGFGVSLFWENPLISAPVFLLGLMACWASAAGIWHGCKLQWRVRKRWPSVKLAVRSYVRAVERHVDASD